MTRPTILRLPIHLMPLLLALAFGSAAAQNNFNLEALNPGEILVNLTVNEQTQVEQDTLHASLYYSAQGRDRIALQDSVNQQMAQIRALLEEGDIEYSIQNYRVYQVQPDRSARNSSENILWRAQQYVQFTGQDSEAVLDLTARLQGLSLTLSDLRYSLSSERQEAVANGLMTAALDKLRSRAAATATALNKSSAEILEISMNSGGNQDVYQRSMNVMAMESSGVATPVAEPGLTTVTFYVNARVVLVP